MHIAGMPTKWSGWNYEQYKTNGSKSISLAQTTCKHLVCCIILYKSNTRDYTPAHAPAITTNGIKF